MAKPLPNETPAPVRELHDLARIAMFAALIGAAAFLSIPFGPMHISLQTMLVVLTGFVLGPKQAALALFLYIACGGLGLPMFGRGQAGPGAFLGPTVGYFLGFVPGAAIAGCSVYFRGNPRAHTAAMIVLGLVGDMVILGCGATGLRLVMGMTGGQALAAGFFAFLGGDIAKVLAAVLVYNAFYRSGAPGGRPHAV